MPLVVPLPLGGLSTELGQQDEDLRAIEATRIKTKSQFVSGASYTTVTGSSSFTYPPGWPSFYASMGSSSGALIGFGCSVTTQSVGGWSFDLFVSIDGAAWNVSTSLYGSVSAPDVINIAIPQLAIFTWVDGTVAPPGQHLFQLQVGQVTSGQPQPLVASNPFMWVTPV